MNKFLNAFIEKQYCYLSRKFSGRSLNYEINNRGDHEQYQVAMLTNYHPEQLKRKRKDSGRFNHRFFVSAYSFNLQKD